MTILFFSQHKGFVVSNLSGFRRRVMHHGKRPALEFSHQDRSKRRLSQERWVVTPLPPLHRIGDYLFPQGDGLAERRVKDWPLWRRTCIADSVGRRCRHTGHSRSSRDGPEVGYCWPQPGCVILCRRVVASSSPALMCCLCEVGYSAQPLLAMAELRGWLEASRSVVRTSDACVAGLQA